LWRELFGQPPPVLGAPRMLTRVLVHCLPPAPPYQPGLASAQAGPPMRRD
jgi:hypothetical protein